MGHSRRGRGHKTLSATIEGCNCGASYLQQPCKLVVLLCKTTSKETHSDIFLWRKKQKTIALMIEWFLYTKGNKKVGLQGHLSGEIVCNHTC